MYNDGIQGILNQFVASGSLKGCMKFCSRKGYTQKMVERIFVFFISWLNPKNMRALQWLLIGFLITSSPEHSPLLDMQYQQNKMKTLKLTYVTHLIQCSPCVTFA